jgi:hypothetical protein
MNLRRKTPNDSLYLLLDTLCNAFGGIILLAVLVVLLTSKEKSQSAAAGDSQEMLQRRLALAQTNLQQALQLQATLQKKANDDRWKTQLSLLTTRHQIQEEIKAVRELSLKNAKELDANASSDPADRMRMLSAQLGESQSRKAEAQNSLAAAKTNITRLNSRLGSLQKQASYLVNNSQRQLRLPKEHDTSKRVIYVIARYGRIYTCRNADLSRNESDIEWESKLASEVAYPKQGMGIDPSIEAARLGAYFRTLTENSAYVAFCVFEDSFPAFIRAKQIAAESGLTYGWDPFKFSDGPVSFSAVGHVPKPQ